MINDKSGLSDSVRSPWQYHPMHVDTGVLSGQLVLDNNTDEACGNFNKAKELGDPNTDDLIKKYCK